MSIRLWLASTLLMYCYIVDEDVFAVITEKEGLWFKENEQQNTEPEVINTERNLMIRKKKATDRVDSDVQNHDSDMLTRINNMEKHMNELMKSVNDILQINTKIQTKLINVQEELDSKIHHVIDQLNDKFEILENKLDKSVVNTSHGMHTLEQKVHNIESAASLLAISKIRPADLPYTMHCDSNIEGGAQSHMEACIQTRVAKLYDEFNDVLDFHVMLVNGAGPHEGRVEIVYRGQHGTICDTLWDDREATVVCKMLGYGKGGYPYRGSRFGNGTGEIFLEKLECTGEEGSLLGCKHRGINGYDDVGYWCHHGRDAGVKCSKATALMT